MFCKRHFAAVVLSAVLVSALSQAVLAQTIPHGIYLTVDEARPVISEMSAEAPADLLNLTGAAAAATWTKWVTGQDTGIRARLGQGDEDSLVNLLLFGTSFTKQPRILFAQLQKPDESLKAVFNARLDDFVTALAAPGTNERMLFARQVLLQTHGMKLTSAADREKIKDFMRANLARIFQESDKYGAIIAAARLQNNPSFEFAERSKLYKDRGLSSDTQTQPNYGLETALRELKEKGSIGKILKVGIAGPGLDFTDKQEGYDFYPLQSIQPFAVMDSLVKLGLADKRNLKLVTMDISPRINLHIQNARKNALAERPYNVTIPIDNKVEWTPSFVDFWKVLGNQVGKEKPLPQPPGFARARVVTVDPAVVANVSPSDVNIVLQHLELAPAEKFDLIIATNIMIYYDGFQQALAMANIEKMLKPGGIFLCNNSMPETAATNLHSIGYSSVKYSTNPPSGDIIVWYQKGK
ncbi:MAG: class I SAM-dependent methyltransferase [Acidobacteria bacterium]|nr:class I SAM-dependent methyltransferase [Acidobacteriota bacterium]